jgi:hypothetical protein
MHARHTPKPVEVLKYRGLANGRFGVGNFGSFSSNFAATLLKHQNKIK